MTEDAARRAEEAVGTAEEARQEAVEARVDASAAREDAAEAKDEARDARETAESVEEVIVDSNPETLIDTRRPQGPAQFGRLGRPMTRSSPFYVGFVGALGVFLAWLLVQAMAQARSVLVLIVVSLFLAIGLNPAVEALIRRGMRRSMAVAVVFFVVIAGFVAFGFVIVPPVIDQTSGLVQDAPGYLDQLRSNSTIARLDRDYGIIQRAQDYITSGDLGQRVFGGLLGVGKVVLGAVFSALSVLILTLYFLSALPSMKRQAYRLVPASRRQRVQLITDEILVRIGGFVSGAFTVALIATLASYLFLRILDLPFALALAVLVGLLDLVPLVGATIGAVVVTSIAFLESPTKGFICLAFYIAYQQVENYLIYPRVMRRAVDVPAAVTIVAALLGGTLLGVVGALLAIPLAAAMLLIVREVTIPRADTT